MAHSTLLRLCQVGKLIYSHFFAGTLSPPSGKPALCAHIFASNSQFPLIQWMERMTIEA